MGERADPMVEIQRSQGVVGVARLRDGYKRPLDLAIWFSAHLLLFPLWLALWALIPLGILIDDGRPVFYRIRRVGKDGKVFDVLKFRTMIRDAEALGPLTVRSDPRITRFGRFLRKTALDELPQVLAILKGDMSFVGPRPHGVRSHEIYERQEPRFHRRLQVRPGLTGLAAIYGARDNPRQKLRYDLLYIKRMSLWLDIKLVLISIWIAIRVGWERYQGQHGPVR